jgi:hypothetical protein
MRWSCAPGRVTELVDEHRVVHATGALSGIAPERLEIAEDVQEVPVGAPLELHFRSRNRT